VSSLHRVRRHDPDEGHYEVGNIITCDEMMLNRLIARLYYSTLMGELNVC